MELRLAGILDKEKWNQFVMSQETGSFCQTWEWGDLISWGEENAFRFVVEEGGDWLGVIFLFKKKLKLGRTLLYAPRGPVYDEARVDKVKFFQLLMREIDALAKRERAMVFQLDLNTNDGAWCKIFDDNGFVKAQFDIQPRHTLILDLRLDIEEISRQMHQKTRYNIHLAEKKGVEIVVDNSAYKDYSELQKKTVKRQGIIQHSEDYFKKIIQLPFVKLYLAKLKGKAVAANIMVFWNNVAIYLFGASDYEYRQVMAPYLLQWQAIKDAKREGYWFYDFWGAAPPNMKGREERWSGFTRFKMGFSPDAEITESLGTYEKQYQPVQLGLYRFLQKIYRR